MSAGRGAALSRRSQLFLPANRPDRVGTAAGSGADAVVVDLEDSVAPGARAAARAGVAGVVTALRTARPDLHVVLRVNADDSLAADLDAAVAGGADGVLVPKVEAAASVVEVEDLLDAAERRHGAAPGLTEVQLLVETPRGLLDVPAIAAAGRRTVALMLGAEDLATELEVDPAHPDADLRWAHAMVLCAARAHGLAPYGLLRTLAEFRDLAALRRDAERSRAFGFVGTLCIHPAQVAVLHEAFAPGESEVAHAREVLEALATAERDGRAAAQVGGRMVDTPTAERARRLLARAVR